MSLLLINNRGVIFQPVFRLPISTSRFQQVFRIPRKLIEDQVNHLVNFQLLILPAIFTKLE